MRKEYVFFFALFGVAAMITGFTVGFVANYQYIEQGIQAKMTSHELVEQPAKTNANQDQEEADEVADTAGTTSSRASVPVAAYQIDVNSPLSANDMQEVCFMLDALNVETADTETERIRNFQHQTGIDPTGELDAHTLDAIIQQMAVKSARAQLYGG